jgi:DNA-binding NtrC family response regulator
VAEVIPAFAAPVQPVQVAAASTQVPRVPAAAPVLDSELDEERAGSGARVDDVDFYALARTRGLSLKDLRHQLEMQCIRRALIEADGNISEAARLLMMKRSRLSQIVNAEPELKEVCRGD